MPLKKKKIQNHHTQTQSTFLHSTGDQPLQASGNNFRLSDLYVWQTFHSLHLH